VTRRWRTVRYGASIVVVLVGVICGATIPGTLGGTLATALIGIGLVGVVSLIFYEVGLSEDRDRSRSGAQVVPPAPEQADPTADQRGAQDRPARPRRLDRRRGARRRLG
jgi:hypothetical protein